MSNVHRRVVADGGSFCIECAVRRDLTSPVAIALDELAVGKWKVRKDRTLDGLDKQVSLHDTFLAGMEHLAKSGEVPRGLFVNVLEDGIWEFKRASVRVTYYDTDGRGGHWPKYAERSLVTGRVAWPDEYDEYLRLTTMFEKTTQKTPEGEIYRAKRVREEDLEHDR